MSTFGENLYYARQALGLTRRNVAELIMRSPSQYGAWERGEGEPLIHLARAVADALEVSLDALMECRDLPVPDHLAGDTFAERIRAARRARGWSIDKLAEASGVGPVSLWNWETGRQLPHLSMALYAAEALDVSLDWLVRGYKYDSL